MRLYIIRHGETPWNSQLRLQGQTDVALNEKGRALARETARALRDIPFDLVITSPLGRAKETAQLVLGAAAEEKSAGSVCGETAAAAARPLPAFVEDERIREIGFGEMEGRQISKEEREDHNSEFYCFFHDPAHYVPARGGETIEALCRRTADFLDDLKKKEAWQEKTILVSTHGAASRALLAAMKHTPLAGFWEGGVPKNCAVTIADLEQDTWIIREQDVVYYENV